MQYFLVGMGLTWVFLGSVIPGMEVFVLLGLLALVGAAGFALVTNNPRR